MVSWAIPHESGNIHMENHHSLWEVTEINRTSCLCVREFTAVWLIQIGQEVDGRQGVLGGLESWSPWLKPGKVQAACPWPRFSHPPHLQSQGGNPQSPGAETGVKC